jgi:hypothetical protein
VVGICAWDRELEQTYSLAHVEEHAALLDRLQVERELEGRVSFLRTLSVARC